MKISKYIILIALGFMLMALVAGCSEDQGPDVISSGGSYTPSDISGYTCVDCHLNPDMPAINPLLAGGSGTAGKHDKHYTERAFDCEKCHFDYTSSPNHFNSVFDVLDPAATIVIFDATNPSGVWNADTGAGTGQCATTDCHNPGTLSWYDATTWTTPTCDTCHPQSMGVRKPVMGGLGNFVENAAMATFHIVNTVDPAEAQCLICHEQAYHMAGTIRLNNADTGATVLLDEADLSTAEPFCLSCHDLDGAMTLGISNMTPFEDGITLGAGRYKMSSEIDMRWSRAYGHQRQGLTCLGTGEPNTGCHEGGHGSEFAGLLTKKLLLPNVWGPYTSAKEPNYALCFECHDNYPAVTKEVILGVKQGSVYDNDWWWWVFPPYYIANTVTKFLDRNEQGTGESYDDNVTWMQYDNLHFFHLEDGFDSWYYRGVGSGWAPTSCIACHDMHGTDTQWGFMYDEFQYAHYNGTGNDQYAEIGIYGGDLPNYPINCSSAFNCHKVFDDSEGGVSAWFAPVIE